VKGFRDFLNQGNVVQLAVAFVIGGAFGVVVTALVVDVVNPFIAIPFGKPDFDTLVLTVNGNDGSDHGTATVALFAGGALRGGRVVADWPGLKDADLRDKRDLKPTADLRSVLKGLLRDHLRVNESHLEATVFPESAAARPTEGLLLV